MFTIRKRIIVAALAAPILMLSAGSNVAWADVSVGQHLKVSDYSCGANERITSSDTIYYGPVPTKQHAQIYRNCGSGVVKRKADVKYDTDGQCRTVPGNTAMVIDVEQALPSRTVYNGAKSC